MNFEDFLYTLDFTVPPETPNKVLKALWWDAKGNWDRAHRIVQDLHTTDAARVHAYLHRKEGDLSNASFWYTSAGKRMPTSTIVEEWQEILSDMLGE